MSPKESLDIIARMMSQTRRSVLSDVYFPFLVWGWSTMGICLTVYLGLVLTGDATWKYAWLLLPVVGLCGLMAHGKRELQVNTELTGSLLMIWRMLGLVLAGFSVTAYIVSFNVLFFILLMLAIGSYVTGAVIKYAVFALCLYGRACHCPGYVACGRPEAIVAFRGSYSGDDDIPCI